MEIQKSLTSHGFNDTKVMNGKNIWKLSLSDTSSNDRIHLLELVTMAKVYEKHKHISHTVSLPFKTYSELSLVGILYIPTLFISFTGISRSSKGLIHKSLQLAILVNLCRRLRWLRHIVINVVTHNTSWWLRGQSMVWHTWGVARPGVFTQELSLDQPRL